MSFGSSFLTKGKSVALQKCGNEVEQLLAQTLYDDNKEVISSFDMNRIASLTYGGKVCEQIYDFLEGILENKLSDNSHLAIQKTLALLKHLVIYGSEDSVQYTYGIGHLVRQYLNYNTVLHGGKANSIFLQIKGGGVDKGGPIRDEAKYLYDLLSGDRAKVRQLRETKAAPDSLVPIGKKDEVAFQTQNFAAKTEMMGSSGGFFGSQQNKKSNLVDQKGGFGSGYNPRDSSGRVVVGAAHSIEDMMERAAKAKTFYCDDVNDRRYKLRLEQQELEKKRMQQQQNIKQKPEIVTDLLDFSSEPTVTSTTTATTATGDLLNNFPPVEKKADIFDPFDTPSNVNNEADLGTPIASTLPPDTSYEAEILENRLKEKEDEINKLKKSVMGGGSDGNHNISSVFDSLSLSGPTEAPTSSPPPLPDEQPPDVPPSLPNEPPPSAAPPAIQDFDSSNYKYEDYGGPSSLNSEGYGIMGGNIDSYKPDDAKFQSFSTSVGANNPIPDMNTSMGVAAPNMMNNMNGNASMNPMINNNTNINPLAMMQPNNMMMMNMMQQAQFLQQQQQQMMMSMMMNLNPQQQSQFMQQQQQMMMNMMANSSNNNNNNTCLNANNGSSMNSAAGTNDSSDNNKNDSQFPF